MPLQQIKERKIVQWTLAYLAASWALLQLAQFFWQLYGLPSSVLRVLPVFLGIGLLVVIVLAWFHGEKGSQRVGGMELAMLSGILVLTGGVFFLIRANSTEAKVGDVVTADSVAAEQGSIAVLPFADMSPGKTQAWFADGLTEELLNVLAQLPELRVAARTSAFAFRDSKVSIDSIAKALRVEYVLEGSVRTAGDQVRITAQLIKASTGYHVWSDTYNRELKDVFAVQDEISSAIVDALRIRIGGGKAEGGLAHVDTRIPAAHQALLKAVHAYREGSNANTLVAREMAEQAVRLDPNYARGHALLAAVHVRLAYRRIGAIEANYDRAEQLARRAIELAPDVPDGYVVLARVSAYQRWDFPEAERLLSKAIALSPGFADAYDQRSWLLMRLGRPEAAIASAKRSASLDPLSTSAYNTLGAMYAYADQPAASVNAYLAALAVDPNDMIVYANLALSYSTMKQHQKAVDAVGRALAADSSDFFSGAVSAYVRARAGDRVYAERWLRTNGSQSNYQAAMVQVGLGRHDEAIRLLERAVEAREDFAPDLGVDDVFDPLRSDPRMNELLKKIGLPV